MHLGEAIHLWCRGVSRGQSVTELLVQVACIGQEFQGVSNLVLHFPCGIALQCTVLLVL